MGWWNHSTLPPGARWLDRRAGSTTLLLTFGNPRNFSLTWPKKLGSTRGPLHQGDRHSFDPRKGVCPDSPTSRSLHHVGMAAHGCATSTRPCGCSACCAGLTLHCLPRRRPQQATRLASSRLPAGPLDGKAIWRHVGCTGALEEACALHWHCSLRRPLDARSRWSDAREESSLAWGTLLEATARPDPPRLAEQTSPAESPCFANSNPRDAAAAAWRPRTPIVPTNC